MTALDYTYSCEQSTQSSYKISITLNKSTMIKRKMTINFLDYSEVKDVNNVPLDSTY